MLIPKNMGIMVMAKAKINMKMIKKRKCKIH